MLRSVAVRAAKWLPWAAIATLVCACGGVGKLSPDTPTGVNLAGTWRLNRAASDDPRKALEALRPKPRRGGSRWGDPDFPDEDDGPVGGSNPARDRGAGGGSGPPGGGREDSTRELARMMGPGQFEWRALEHVLTSNAERGDSLTIEQSANGISMEYGNSRRRYAFGGESVVSVRGGVADQRSGWHDREFVIEVRPQSGADVVERYALSPDGRQLIIRSVVGGRNNIPKVELTSVYDAGPKIARPIPGS